MKIENENKKFFPPKATKTQDQQTWVMTYCLLTQKYASYKVGFSKKKRGKYRSRTLGTIKQSQGKYREENTRKKMRNTAQQEAWE